MRWLCPKCQRAISLAYEVCPFCGGTPEEPAPEPAKPAKPPWGVTAGWEDVKRGFRFGVGFLLAVGIVLFAMAAVFLLLGHGDWMNRLLIWLGRLFG